MGPMGFFLQQEMGQDCIRPKKPKDLFCPPQGPKPGPTNGMGVQTSALGMLTTHQIHLAPRLTPKLQQQEVPGTPKRNTALECHQQQDRMFGWPPNLGEMVQGQGRLLPPGTSIYSCPWFSIQGAWAVCSYRHRLSALTPGLLPKVRPPGKLARA